jgi:exodeoxyribonuclease V alpha subunit
MTQIRGVIKKVLRQGKTALDNSFLLIDYEDENGKLIQSGRLSAKIDQFETGDSFFSEGYWKENFFNGQSQPIFTAQKIHPDFPFHENLSFEYLKEKFTIKSHGIQEANLNKLIWDIGEDSVKKILEQPNLLTKISDDEDIFREPILNTISDISNTWKAVEILKESQVKESVIKRIIEVYKKDSFNILNDNPYEILNLTNIDFSEADKIGKKIGIKPNDYRRLKAAMFYCLKQESLSGSTAFPAKMAIERISDSIKVEKDIIKKFLIEMVKLKDNSKFIVSVSPKTGLPVASLINNYHNEIKAADNICRILKNGNENSKLKVKEAAQVIMRGKPFDEHQRSAVEIAASEPVSIITGGPGTGKSTILNSAIEITKRIEPNSSIFVVAPTGKAAKRAEETTGEKATTLQMLLGMKENEKDGTNSFTRNKDNPLPENCVIFIDEVSMMDTELIAALMDALPNKSRVVFQGDKDQLPSVGAGKVLSDLMESELNNKSIIPIAELVNVYRQDKTSKIATDSKKINSGEVPFIDSNVRGGVCLQEFSSDKISNEVLKIYQNSILKIKNIDPLKDVAIITPQSTGYGGTWELNNTISKLLNPDGVPIPGVDKKKFDDERLPVPRVGDKVMLTENDHENEVMNGDIGIIKQYRMSDDKNPYKTEIEVEFENGKKVDFPVNKWRNLILAYAITCHKSQGSQYPIVILPWSKMHKHMSERTLLYTAWTRAKDLVIGVGEKEIFEHSVKTFKMKSRNTNLSERIQEFAQKYRIEPKGDKSYRQQEIIESDKKIVSGMNSEKSNSIKSSGKISIPKVKDIGKKSKSTSSISKPKLKIKPVSFNKGIAPK